MVYNHYGGEPLFIFYYIRFIGIVLLLLCRKIRERKDIKIQRFKTQCPQNVSHKHVSHRHVSHVSHHVRQHVTAPTAAPHKKADIECKILFSIFTVYSRIIYFREFSKFTILKIQFLRFISFTICLLYTSPSPRDGLLSRMPSSA